MSVDFPLPDTPVTPIIIPRGKVTSIFFKLLPLQPNRARAAPLPFLLSLGSSIDRVPFKYWAVNVDAFKVSLGVPCEIIVPPFFPA